MKRYSYRYRQVLGVCKNVSARGRLGGLGPLNVNLGPLLPRKLLELARKLKLKTQLDVVSHHFGYTKFFPLCGVQGAQGP